MRDRRGLLERILVGNVLVALRHLEIELGAGERVLAALPNLRERTIHVKDNQFLGVRVHVTTNLVWSPWLGLGKQVAKGFGLFEELD